MADWLKQWEEDKKKRDQSVNPKSKNFSFKEASQAQRIQYTNPYFSSTSAEKTTPSFNWEKKMLGPLRGYGRSYNDRFDNLTKRMGLSSQDAQEFRKFLDSRETPNRRYQTDSTGKIIDKRRTVYGPPGTQTVNEQIGGILKDAADPNSLNNKFNSFIDQAWKAQDELAKKKAKQTGQPQQTEQKSGASGVISKILDIVDRPGNAVRTGIDQQAHGGNFLEGLKQGFTGQTHTTGDQVNKDLGFNADKAGSLPQKIATFLGRGFVADTPGGLTTAAVNDKIANDLGKGTAGTVTEMALDPLNLVGTGVGAKVLGKLKAGKTVAQVAKEENVPEDAIGKLINDLQGRTFQRESSGQIIDPNAPRLNAPNDGQSAPLGLNGPQGLPEPLINRTVQGLGKDVQVQGTPQLEAPKTGRPIRSQAELNQLEADMKNTWDQRQAMEGNYVNDALAPFRESQAQQAAAEQTWNTTVKQAKQMAQRIKDYHGGIVPDGNSKDLINEIPKQFKAKKGSKGNDIYSFAQQEGFKSADEAVQFLKQLDADTKIRLKDLAPNDGMKIHEDQWKKLEDAARKSFADSKDGQAVDSLLNDLMNIHKAHMDSVPKGEPLQFKREKQFKVTEKPVSYTRKMSPEELKQQKFDGSFSTKQVGDKTKITSQPSETKGFKTQAELKGFKTTAEKKINRGAVEVDGRKQATPKTTVKPETSSNGSPVGITPNQAHVNDVSWVNDPKNLAQKIKDGEVSFANVKKEGKRQFLSDLHPIKEVMDHIAKQDMGDTLTMMGKKGKDVAFEDSLYKGLRSVRRSVSAALKASKEDYGKVISSLKSNKISKRDFDEYASAVHFADILANNEAKVKRAGDIAQELADVEKKMEATTNKKAIEKLKAEEKKLLEEKDTLDPYIIPKEATPEKIQRVLDRWKNTPAMENARIEFMKAQRKDLKMQVESGIITKAQMDAMIKAHPNYVYMGRATDESGVFGASGNISKANKHILKRKNGSEDNLKLSPLDAAVQNRMLTYHNVSRNNAMKSIEKLSTAKGGKDYFSELNMNTASDAQKRNAVYFFKNGKKVYYEVPPVLKQAFDSLDEKSAQNWASKAIRAANTVIRKGGTHYNTDFIFSSPLRETNALVTSRTGMHPGHLALGYMDSFFGKGIEKLGFKSYRDVYEKLGGDSSGYVSRDPDSLKKFTKAMAKGKLAKGIEIINPAEWIHKVGGAVEHGPKLGEFRSAKAKGFSNKDAMHEAADVIDYADLGSATRSLNKYIPFLGPMVKGTSRYFQAAKENPAGWAAKNLMYVTAPTLAIYSMRFAPWATDEQRSKIRNMSDWQKNMFWSMPAPDGKSVWSIPKMHVGAQIFANPVERILDKLTNDNPKAWSRIAKDTGKDLGTVLTPPYSVAGLQLLTDSMANYNRLMDMPIEDMTMQRTPDKTKRYNAFTSELAKGIGKKTGQSPAKVDYVLKGLTAGTGRDVLDLTDNAIAKMKPGSRPSKVDTSLDIINPVRRYQYKDTAGTGTYDKLYQAQQVDDAAKPYYEDFKALNKKIRKIRESKSLSSADKKKQIAALRDEQRKVGDEAIKSGILKNR